MYIKFNHTILFEIMQISEKLISLITQFDLFALPVELLVNKKDKYRSIFGAILSIITLSIMCVFFWKRMFVLVKRERLFEAEM